MRGQRAVMIKRYGCHMFGSPKSCCNGLEPKVFENEILQFLGNIGR